MKRSVLLGLIVLLLPGCTFILNFLKDLPKNQTKEEIAVLAALLPEQGAKELRVYHKNHTNLLDGRVHTEKTCPFLIYKPKLEKYEAGQMSDKEWAEFLHEFYGDKHDEEKDLYDCDCEEQLEE